MLNQLPRKYFYTIGEVGRWLNTETTVLRYWETEFSRQLGPIRRTKGGSRYGQRYYSRAQAVTFAAIKELLHVELYTIAGARRQLDRVLQDLKAS